MFCLFFVRLKFRSSPSHLSCALLTALVVSYGLRVSRQGEAEVFESTSIDGDCQSALTLQIPPQYKDRMGLCCTFLKHRVRAH